MEGRFVAIGRSIFELAIRNVRGERGLGVFRLLFEVSIAPERTLGEESVRLTDLVGRLTAQAEPGGARAHLGYLRPLDGPVLIDVRNAAAPAQIIVLELELDLRRLTALNDLRAGRGLGFEITLWGLVTHQGQHRVDCTLRHRINQGTWVELLDEMGFGHYLLLEVPVPRLNEAAELARSVEFLREAQAALEVGRYRDAVGACRDGIEALGIGLGDADAVNGLSTPFSGSREWDKATRF